MPGGPGDRPHPPRKPGTAPAPATLATAAQPGVGGGSSGGGGYGGGVADSNPELLTRGTGPLPEWIMRDFTGGMHCNPARDALHEQDLWWLENMQPLASGNVLNVGRASPYGVGTSQPSLPFYSVQVFVGGQPAIFSVFNDGSGQLTYINSGLTTQIMAPGTLPTTPGSVAAATYIGSTAGFLIVSTTGYWDFGVTTANTLTSLSGGIASSTNTTKNTTAGGTALKQITTGTGTGTVLQVHYQVTTISLNTAGTGYIVGDVLSLTDNNPVSPATITVTATSSGAIAGITLSTSGDYPGPTSSALVNTGPTGNVVTGGTGTGATFHVTIQALKLVIVSPGSGWTGSPTLTDETATPVIVDRWNLTIGVTTGTSLAVYAGRVWIGNLNTLNYTDVNSYNSFGGAGGQSTLPDSYLGGQGITCLYSANNYLYIFANAAVDILSNVQVNATTGITTFSRVNVLQGLGVSYYCTMSVIGYARGIAFMDTSGYYMLTGASPERISDRWQAVVRTIAQTSLVSAATFNLNNELCLGVLVTMTDTFSQVGPQQRVLVFIYQRRRWWVYSPSYFNAQSPTSYGPVVGIPNNGLTNLLNPPPAMFLWGMQNSPNVCMLLQAFIAGATPWVIRTKLWDGASAFREKQPINVALGVVYQSLAIGLPTFSFTVDTEHGASTSVALPGPGVNVPGYFLSVFKGLAETTTATPFGVYGSQFIGLTFNGTPGNANNMLIVESVAMRGKQERNILE